MKNIVLFIAGIFLLSSCDRFTDHFFSFLLNSEGINLSVVCSDRPPVLADDGRIFEVYSIRHVNTALIIKNIINKPLVASSEYHNYHAFQWKKSPILNSTDTIYAFVHSEMKEKNTCYNEAEIVQILRQQDNFYACLIDNWGAVKLFIWDVKRQKLFVLTSLHTYGLDDNSVT